MRSMLDEYFLNPDLYSDDDIEENTIRFMGFFVQINSLLRDVYASKNDEEFTKAFNAIYKNIAEFYEDTIPGDKIFDSSILNNEDKALVGDEDINERKFFIDLTLSLVEFIFNRSLQTKYSIITIICAYYEDDNKDKNNADEAIQAEIEEFISLSTNDE
jgi:hypothetical protein